MANDLERGRGVLKNVAIYYTAIQQPKNKYQSEEKAYSVTVVTDKATATAFSKEFPKKSVTPIDNDEFMEKYKTDVPFPENAIQYTFRLSQDELKKDGTPIPDFARPRLLLEDASGQIYDITDSDKVAVGNGSRADVHYAWYGTKMGKAVRLSNVVVKKLVKYERTTSDGYIDMAKVKALPDDFDLDGITVDQPEGKETPTVPTEKAETITDANLPF